MKYKVIVTLEDTYLINADSQEEAKEIARDMAGDGFIPIVNIECHELTKSNERN
jgi:hypothetical protein